ncbi:MAG TPA: S8 family serine peptidase [Myxococcaceae bacterium]|nr:S8 family serine peptidase [Myxococcaceae bacterium]
MKLRGTKVAMFSFSMLAAACGAPMAEDMSEMSAETAQQEIKAAAKAEPGQVAELLRSPNAVRDEYIVTFREDMKEVAQRGSAAIGREIAAQHGGQVLYVYEHALKGFAVRMPAARVEALQKDPRVLRVEENGYVQAVATQSNATWGIDRVDQRALPLSGTYVYNADGAGAHVYIVDTGVKLTHQEFTGRMGTGFDAVTSGGSANDCNGHGTHVAGTTAGTVYGIAKRATVHPVRVLDCNGSGTNAGVIAGVDWVKNNHVRPAVANMSLGGGASQALDDSVNNAVAAGVVFVVAAGNDNQNACNYSPARAANALTVGSTTNGDARSSFSNYGTCLDIFAPGSSITSAWHTSDSATNSISGTSMASPHVAGVAALYVAANTSATPSQVEQALESNATSGVITSIGTGSPNLLLYSAFIGGGGGGDTTAPTTSITEPTGGSTVSGTAVTVSASASDNVGVSKVDFYVGATLIGSDTTSPYSVSWNSTGVANGSYNITSKAFDAAGNVGTSAAVAVTVSNTTGNCSITEQLLLNAGFESGNVNWTTTSGVISATTNSRTGSYSAWLNGYGTTRTDSAYQQITIPATACAATFKFWVKITSSETTTTSAYDKLAVQIRDSANVVKATLATYSNLNKSSTYAEKTFDLSAYKGQTIRVYFLGTEDSSLATSFFVDDTSVTITR